MNNDHQQQQDKEDDNIQGNTTPKIQLQWTKKKKHISIPSYQRSTKRPLPDTTTTTTNGNSNDNNNNHNNSNTADSLSNGVNRYNNDTVPSQFFSFQDDDDQLGNDQQQQHTTITNTEPLIIPVIQDTMKWKKKQQQPQILEKNDHTTFMKIKQEDMDDDKTNETNNNKNGITTISTLDAIQALQHDADHHQHQHQNGGIGKTVSASPIVIITTTTNRIDQQQHHHHQQQQDQEEQQQYQQDIQSLPDALDISSQQYQTIPISDFGAAMLRGMGWNDTTNNDKSNSSNHTTTTADILPRPHRLGLGAIPMMIHPNTNNNNNDKDRNKSKNIHQYQYDIKVQQQNNIYRQELETKRKHDLQYTMQNGSIVYIVPNNQEPNHMNQQQQQHDTKHHHHETQQQQRRAKIIQLVGVPGLNMVQIQYEYDDHTSIIKRHMIDRLVSHDEIQHHPYIETAISSTNKQDTDTKQEIAFDENSNHHHKRKHDSQSKSKVGQQSDSIHKSKGTTKSSSSSKMMLLDPELSWVIPNIRVRIISNKLGNKYYKEKGIVIDVTRSAGVTIQMNHRHNNINNNHNNNIVLDHIPERYLETALPKIGGHVIVVQKGHIKQYQKGKLLDRTSKMGTVQLYDDMDCITISLDDIAEFCGPLDDDDDFVGY